MRNEIRSEIKRLCKKQFDKARSEAETAEKYRTKFTTRTGLVAKTKKSKPSPILAKHFDPTHCKRNANVIATGIWHSVLNKKYVVQPAIQHFLDKPDGSKREIMAFGIPDAALANVLLRRTRTRNLKRLSPHSYAYHPDKNVFDAVLALKDFDDQGKMFAVQIDFKKFFDSIPTGYIRKKINDRDTVSFTPHERIIFDAFLNHKYAEKSEYAAAKFRRRVKGTPQGSSASLILANVANHDLDRKLAFESGKFVRFADDVVALSNNYEGAIKLEKCFQAHCKTSGLVLNKKKSPGIGLISNHSQELRTHENFTYLGYSFSEDGLSMPEKSALKLKQKVSRLLNIYLINSLKFGFNPSRSSAAAGFDWDLLGFVYELRRSLYGGLREKKVTGFLNGTSDLERMRGLMGFYAVLDNSDMLKELDGWIVNITVRACKRRRAILKTQYGCHCPTPNSKELITGRWLNKASWRLKEEDTDDLEVQFPSLVRGWRAARKYYFTRGLENVQPPSYQSSDDILSLFDFY